MPAVKTLSMVLFQYFSPTPGGSSEGYMDAYGPAYSNGLAQEEGEDYSDTEVEGNYMVEVESFEGSGPSTPQKKDGGGTSLTSERPDGGGKDTSAGEDYMMVPDGGAESKKKTSGEKDAKAGDDYMMVPDGGPEAKNQTTGEDYGDELFESYDMTNDGTQQFKVDIATGKNKTNDSSHSNKEPNSTTAKNNTKNSGPTEKNNATDKNNTTNSSSSKEENNDYKAYEYEDEDSITKNAGTLDPEVILIMRYSQTY